MGAAESNAGDAFHFWWAASRALALLEPGTDLRLVAVEGLSIDDDPDDQYETVDLAEYYEGLDVSTATRIVLSQLKHSTRHPSTPWTTARLCERRRRGARSAGRSVAADLAAAYRQVVDDHGPDAAAKTTIALVTNQPADPGLIDAVSAAAGWIRSQSVTPTRKELLAALAEPHRSAIASISAAIGNRLRSREFSVFVTALDLTNASALGHAALARAVRAGVSELTPGMGPDSARRLFHLVQQEALPGPGRGGLAAQDVLAELGVADIADLYPAPPRFSDVPNPLPTPAASSIADAAAAAAAAGGTVVAHGPAGAGKTTALLQVPPHLPAGSKVIMFDAYGGGDYLSSGEERHTPQRFVSHIANELAQQCGTPLLVQPPALEPDLWRRLTRTLANAVATLDPEAVLVIAVDAADNAAIAAKERGDRGFLPGLVALPLPNRVAVVLTARTHRVDMLAAPEAAPLCIATFDNGASAAHLRRYFPTATDADAREFHTRTGGNPRAQFYALTQTQQSDASIEILLDACNRTPEPVFDDLVHSALQVSGAGAGGEKWLAAMLALARPVPLESLAAALDVPATAVAAFAAGLDPGVTVAGDAIQFRDEDFETYVRGRVDPSAIRDAHDRLATMFLAARHSDADAAAHVADHLVAAGRNAELLELVLGEESPAGIVDGFRREQVQARRLDLSARAAAAIGDAAAAVRVAARGCDTASRLDTLSRLVDTRLDLVARYADIELLRAHALRETRSPWLGPVLMRMAAALSRDPSRRADALAELDNAEAWLRRWIAGQESGETRHWEVENDDVAAAAEARYRLDGPAAAIDELARWSPPEFVVEAAGLFADRVADDATPEQLRGALQQRKMPLILQAAILGRLAGNAAPAPDWLEQVTTALAADPPPDELQPWHLDLLGAALQSVNTGAAAAIAARWSRELPSRSWAFADVGSLGTMNLRCHAASAVLAGTPLDVDALVPAALRPAASTGGGHGDDRRGYERREWLETVRPLARAAELAVRAAIGAAAATDVEGAVAEELAKREVRADHRWFTHDRTYRTWACLTAEAVVEAEAPAAVIDRLADAAPALLREGAAAAWLDIASTLAHRGAHIDRALDLCLRAATAASAAEHSAADRLELLATAAELAGRLDDNIGRDLFGRAVDAATGINDAAAEFLGVHADLARRAAMPPDRAATAAALLIAAAEAVAPHVSDSRIVPYTAVAGGAARLHPQTGLAAVSRWDDATRVPLSDTLPAALTAAVDHGQVPAWQALPLDHLVENAGRRLIYQLDIAGRLHQASAAGRTEARLAIVRAATWIRRHVTAHDQPRFAVRLLEWAAPLGLDAAVREVLDPIAAFATPETPDPNRNWPQDPPPPSVRALLDAPALRSWRELADDVAALQAAHIFGDPIRQFIADVALTAAPTDRVAALDAVAALGESQASTSLAALAYCVTTWHSWPPVRVWAADALQRVVADRLPELAWRSDTDTLIAQLRALGNDDAIRRAVLLAIPDARPKLASLGWQNIAALLSRLCPPAAAADALTGLLEDRVPPDAPVPPPVDEESAGPVVPLLWSAFGHPRRSMRWRAAHAARGLLAHPGGDTAAFAEAIVGCLDRDGAGRWRDPALHFYRLSALATVLLALHRTAHDRPALVSPHLDKLVQQATGRELPHAQIRELARLTALAVAPPPDPVVDALGATNMPDRCRATRDGHHQHDDRRISDDRRYQFDTVDTIPYWYAPLARVFDLPVDTVAARAESWILDHWGLDQDDWWTDARELRDDRSYERQGHRHGSIPPEENLRLYIEYHAMMTAAGELVDERTPMQVATWHDDDPWRYWLDPHLPRPGVWLADLASPVPVEPDLFGNPSREQQADDLPAPAEFDSALQLEHGALPDQLVVGASVTLRRLASREHTYIASALASPNQAEDLQRALAAASNPMDWKLPQEDERDFEVDAGDFQLHGWIAQPHDQGETLDEHDPNAAGLRHALPLPGREFRATTGGVPDYLGTSLIAPDGSTIATAQQWADPDENADTIRGTVSSGYRLHVARDALLHHLAATGTVLIVEVQLDRQPTGSNVGHLPPRRSRLYLVDADGHITGS